jgi:hypothetical protein
MKQANIFLARLGMFRLGARVRAQEMLSQKVTAILLQSHQKTAGKRSKYFIALIYEGIWPF